MHKDDTQLTAFIDCVLPGSVTVHSSSDSQKKTAVTHPDILQVALWEAINCPYMYSTTKLGYFSPLNQETAVALLTHVMNMLALGEVP